MVQTTNWRGFIMQLDELTRSINTIEEWVKSTEDKWENAKELLENHIEENELNEWERKLEDIHTNVELIKNKRSDVNTENFILELEYIHEQCKELYDGYNQLSEEFNRTGSPDDETLKDTRQENDGERLEFKNSKSDWAGPKGSVKPGQHKLPPLPYDYDALEPYISKEIVKLHHDKHHQSYVDGLNNAELKMQEARKTGDFDLIRHWEREAAFNGAGHYLHTIFWKVMSPDGGGKPKGALLNQITHDFGSYNAFKKHFSEAAKNVEGVGWAILVWSPRSHRLVILQAEKHQNLSQWDVVPLLVLDVWEHAYYLQYKTDRDKYVDKWWNIVNWDHVAKRFNEAEKLRWKPF